MRVLLIILLSLVSAAAFANLPHDIHKIRQKAQNGDPKSQIDMGHRAKLKNNYKQAYYWFKKVSQHSDPYYKGGGYNLLGMLYMSGRGVPKNLNKARNYFEKAIDLGFKRSYGNLGLIYELGGQGIPQDKKKAKHYYKLAAKNGYAPPMFNLANLYAHQKQYKQAFHWYHQAAKQYYLSGMLQTGLSYSLSGKGVSKDMTKACKWFRLALEVYPDYKDGRQMLNNVLRHMDYTQKYACHQAVKKYLKHHDVPRKSDFKARLELKS